jgi:hypothetical protein
MHHVKALYKCNEYFKLLYKNMRRQETYLQFVVHLVEALFDKLTAVHNGRVSSHVVTQLVHVRHHHQPRDLCNSTMQY